MGTEDELHLFLVEVAEEHFKMGHPVLALKESIEVFGEKVEL